MSELTIRDGSMAIHAKMAMNIRTQLADLESQETNAKDLIKSEALSMATSEQIKGNYVSIIRIIPEDSAPVRTELRITNGALNITDKPKLDKLFGGAVTDLFEQDTQVGTVEDPQGLIDALKARGIDPWTVLGVTVKSDARAIAIQAGAPYTEVIVPKKGFLDTLCELGNRLSNEAKVYITAYLNHTLKPVVVMGTKGK